MGSVKYLTWLLKFASYSESKKYVYKQFPSFIEMPSEELERIVDGSYKQVYKVSGVKSSGILRPEFTYLANKAIENDSSKIYYWGNCFRREKKQFLRLNEFCQMGIECYTNDHDKWEKITLNVIDHFLGYFREIGLENKIVLSIFCTDDLFKKINLGNVKYCRDEFKRAGGVDSSYENCYFEVSMKKPDGKNMEVMGGGSYKVMYKGNKIKYCCGHSIGLERILGLDN